MRKLSPWLLLCLWLTYSLAALAWLEPASPVFCRALQEARP